jgi:hypothetical protein
MTAPLSSPVPRRRLRRVGLIAAGLAALALVAGGTVHAAWDRGGWRGPPEGRGMRVQRLCANDTARFHPVVRAYVRADLRLSEGQAAEFGRLTDLVLPGLEELKREVCNDFLSRRGPAPERLAHLAAVLRKAADTAERAVDPSQKFYSSLDERQKERVDQLTARRGRFER